MLKYRRLRRLKMECENCKANQILTEYTLPSAKHIKISLCDKCADLPFSKIKNFKIFRPLEEARGSAKMFKLEDDYIRYITNPVEVENNTENYLT